MNPDDENFKIPHGSYRPAIFFSLGSRIEEGRWSRKAADLRVGARKGGKGVRCPAI